MLNGAADDRADTSPSSRLIYLDPAQIVADPVTDIRGSAADDETEEKAIRRLAGTMQTSGQSQPVLVRARNHGTDKYGIIAGRRRVMAASLIPGFKLAAYCVEMTDEEAYRAALLENVQRKALGPVALARHIKRVRSTHEEWQGPDGTKHVARYFGCSVAEITTHEKILSLPHELLAQGEREGWAAQTFFLTQKIEPDKRGEVIEEAKRRQAAESAARPPTKQKEAKGKGTATPPARDNRATGKPDGKELKSEPARKAPKLEHKHVVAAARATPGALNEAKPRSRKEICDFFIGLGQQTVVARREANFIAAFGQWEKGEIEDKKLKAVWDKIFA